MYLYSMSEAIIVVVNQNEWQLEAAKIVVRF